MMVHYRLPLNAEHDVVVMSAAACMPASCWGRYRRIGVAVVLAGTTPSMLSTRARGVVSLRTIEKLSARGKVTAFDRALEAEVAAVKRAEGSLRGTREELPRLVGLAPSRLSVMIAA